MEWQTSEDGHTTVTRVETQRVKIRGTPSVFGMPADILEAMNELDVYVAEREKEAMDEAEAQARR